MRVPAASRRHAVHIRCEEGDTPPPGVSLRRGGYGLGPRICLFAGLLAAARTPPGSDPRYRYSRGLRLAATRRCPWRGASAGECPEKPSNTSERLQRRLRVRKGDCAPGGVSGGRVAARKGAHLTLRASWTLQDARERRLRRPPGPCSSGEPLDGATPVQFTWSRTSPVVAIGYLALDAAQKSAAPIDNKGR
jgi:hypothetical protein